MALKPLLPDPRRAAAPPLGTRRKLSLTHWNHLLHHRWRQTRGIAIIVSRELVRTRVFDVAAGVAFWAMMSMIPLLMTVVALISLLPLPGLFAQLLAMLALLLPVDSLHMVEKMVGSLLMPHGAVLSFGVLSYIWSTTGGFTSLITALNIAYDVKTERSWIRDRLQALLLTFTSGGLISIALLTLLAGPHVVHFAGRLVAVPASLEHMWPVLRMGVVFVCFVLALELVYFLGPNMRQHFRSTLPGALFAMILAFSGSYALAFYLDHMANYSRLYGGMGAVIGLMFWIYLVALATLIGAELNAELAKRRDRLFRRHVQTVWGKQRKFRPPAPGQTAA